MPRQTADDLLAALPPTERGGVAAAVVVGSAEPTLSMHPAGVFGPGALFEIGSLTKTMTATLFARMVTQGHLRPDTRVGELFGGEAGAAADVELRELATHTAGLPRLPPNAITIPFWPRDPYRFYGRSRLGLGLSKVELRDRGSVSYSNLGFVLLACCLSAAAGERFEVLLRDEVFEPAGMASARCQPCPRRGLVRGHGSLLMGGRRWHEPLAGAGGVDCSIEDLARWVQINVHPEMTPLEPAIRLCLQPHVPTGTADVGFAWHITDGLTWHNGATGAFQSFAGFFSRKAGAGVLSNVAVTKGVQHDAPASDWLRRAVDADATGDAAESF